MFACVIGTVCKWSTWGDPRVAKNDVRGFVNKIHEISTWPTEVRRSCFLANNARPGWWTRTAIHVTQFRRDLSTFVFFYSSGYQFRNRRPSLRERRVDFSDSLNVTVPDGCAGTRQHVGSVKANVRRFCKTFSILRKMRQNPFRDHVAANSNGTPDQRDCLCAVRPIEIYAYTRGFRRRARTV